MLTKTFILTVVLPWWNLRRCLGVKKELCKPIYIFLLLLLLLLLLLFSVVFLYFTYLVLPLQCSLELFRSNESWLLLMFPAVVVLSPKGEVCVIVFEHGVLIWVVILRLFTRQGTKLPVALSLLLRGVTVFDHTRRRQTRRHGVVALPTF